MYPARRSAPLPEDVPDRGDKRPVARGPDVRAARPHLPAVDDRPEGKAAAVEHLVVLAAEPVPAGKAAFVREREDAPVQIFAALDAGQIDIVANGVSYSEERAEKYAFSTPYNYTQYAVMTLADNDSVNSLADVAGKVSSNDPTSTIGQFAEANGVIFDEVKEAAQAISEVKNGRAEVTFSTTVGFADYFKQHPDEASLFKVIVVSDPEPNAYIPALKGNEDLIKVIDEALEAARQDGTLSDLAIKYFDVDTTKG